jgi:hypothetical protein
VRACNTYGGYEKFTKKKIIGKLEEKRPLGRLRRRWKDNIETNRREIG